MIQRVTMHSCLCSDQMQTKQEPVDSLNLFNKEAVLITVKLQPNYRNSEALYGECKYLEEKAVYIIIINGKSVQWESLKKILQYYKTN